ncbi:MAG TPA: glutathione S-transferase family protein [Rubrivivax sp.]|nr:glutathione S-transferase family protein [Rubrivivax sp.]
MALQLVIGNKNYSSWSMRPWVLMKQLALPFEERRLRLDFHTPDSSFKRELASLGVAGRVPVLLDEGFAVWDSLAIVEYLHERFPAAGVWPTAAHARARARSVCAEMHSGFTPLRSHCGMNIEARLPEVGERIWSEQAAVRADVQRLESMWGAALTESGGPFLFGEFGAADAFYAPVCMRLLTYALPTSAVAGGYVQRVRQAPGVAAWIDEALQEHDWIAEDEPYRRRPGTRAH